MQTQDLKSKIEEVKQNIEITKSKISVLENDISSYEYSISDDDYIEILNNNYNTVIICDMAYDAGYALYNIDNVAFNCSKSDYESCYDLDSCDEYNDLNTDLESENDKLQELEEELEELE